MPRTAIDRGRFANAAACAASFPSFRTTGGDDSRDARPVTTARQSVREPVRFFALFDDSRTATRLRDDPPFQNPQRLGDPQGQVRRESAYFDLNDPEATTGSWDVYGQESRGAVPGQQEELAKRRRRVSAAEW